MLALCPVSRMVVMDSNPLNHEPQSKTLVLEVALATMFCHGNRKVTKTEADMIMLLLSIDHLLESLM